MRCLIRYLVEAPANVCTPSYLADVAAKIQALAPDLFKLTVLEVRHRAQKCSPRA
jgi:leucyl aminopeptidase